MARLSALILSLLEIEVIAVKIKHLKGLRSQSPDALEKLTILKQTPPKHGQMSYIGPNLVKY